MAFGRSLLWLAVPFSFCFACGSSDDPASLGSPTPGAVDESPPTGTTDPAKPDAPQPGDASLGITSTTPVLTLRRGKSVALDVVIARKGFDAAVDLSLAGLPAGVSSKPQLFNAKTGETKATFVLDATVGATLGTTKIKIGAVSPPSAATSNKEVRASTEINLIVADGQRLDPTFGTGGMLNYWPDMRNRWPRALAVQPDAKIIVTCQFSDTPENTPQDLVGGVYRFTDSGALDTSFGTGGLVQLPAFGGGTYIALQPDGNMTLCGVGKTDKRLTLARLTAQGALDPTFGAGGIVKGASNLGMCSGIALDASGRYVLTSYISGATPGTSSAVVARYLPTGALDASFGDAGTGMTTTALGGKMASLREVRVTPQGIFFTGSRQMQGSTYVRGVIAKMNDAGVLDSAFGTQGVHENQYSVFEVLPLADGSSLFGIQNEVFRLTPQGTLDTTYTMQKPPPGGNTMSSGLSVTDAQAMQYRFRWTTISWAAELMAYKADGLIDTTFGDGGRIPVSAGRETDASDIKIAPDGRLVVLAGGGAAIWLARFVL